MVATSKNSSPSVVVSISTRGGKRPPFRKTRWSVVDGDLVAPYRTTIKLGAYGSLLGDIAHSWACIDGAKEMSSCCGLRTSLICHAPAVVPNCLACAMCRGCYACREGYIREETMFMGKWETKDGRRLYPFEMDSTHLMHAIAKLKRDQAHFKDGWEAWVRALEAEARLRKFNV